MNKDYTSDLKIVERFIFENSIYLLNMFEKKIDSFTECKNKQARARERQLYSHPSHTITPEGFLGDPIRNLAKDLTKPIWNCVVRVNPRVVYFDERQTEDIPSLKLFNHIFSRFIERFKNEHQDQSNLEISLCRLSKESQLAETQSEYLKESASKKVHQYTQQLYQMFYLYIEKRMEVNSGQENIEENQYGQTQILPACHEIFQCLLDLQDQETKAELESFNKHIRLQIDTFNRIIFDQFNAVLDYKVSSLAICSQPKVGFMNILIHPLLTSIHNCIRAQMQQNKEREDLRRQKNNLEPEKEEMKEEGQFIYPSLKSSNCSRVVFINLDGYESEFNIDMAKYMSKYMMYISFPKESSNKMESNPLKNFEDFYSKRLLEKYFYGCMGEQEKKDLLSLYEIEQKDMKKNLFVFPVHSRELSSNYDLPSVDFYESTFVSFMLREVCYTQIREFNPSMIVVSYSHKINLANQHFKEIIRQLTVLGNYRVVYYPNLTKTYSFDQPIPSQMIETTDFTESFHKYFSRYQSLIKITEQDRVNTDVMDKLSIFLKVSSGTYNLSKQPEVDCYVQKFKNYKVMSYAGKLMKILGKEYNSIDRLKMRANEYLNISKVLGNMYLNRTDTFDKLFGNVLTKFHNVLLREVQKKFFSEQNLIEDAYSHLLGTINGRCDYVEKKQFWENFRFQYCLEVIAQKTENKLYVHLPRFKEETTLDKKSSDNLLALQFEVKIDQEVKLVDFTRDTKFYYESKRKHPNALIYAINYLPDQNSTQYQDFYGVIDDKIQNKTETKLLLRPLIFEGRNQKCSTKTFTQYNYLESDSYVFMFWPQLYDFQAELLSRIAGTKYVPESTLDIYRAKRTEPGYFKTISVSNKTYPDILPRHGCKCYELVPDSTFYIFGGFYNNEQNYLSFQTDITVINYSEACTTVENLPKSFYFDYSFNEDENVSLIKRIKNDLIRPRVEYEILEPESNLDSQEKQIFLLGGVGEKFIRPYSMVGYMAHKLTFRDKRLAEIKRIKTNNLIPVNVKAPVKNRVPSEMEVITNAQNRSIFTSQAQTPNLSSTIYHNSLYYNPAEERFEYKLQYELAECDFANYREGLSVVNDNITTDLSLNKEVMAKCYRGVNFYTNFIGIRSDNNKKYIQELHLQLSPEVKRQYPSSGNSVRLTGSSILAIDISSPIIYVLINHQTFTLGKCVLAYFDINEFSRELADSMEFQIHLKQIHKFDQDVSKNIVIAANTATIAILHGCKFNANVEVPEMIVKKRGKNQIKTFPVKPCVDSQLFKNLDRKQFDSIATSLFRNSNKGRIECFSFKTIERVGSVQRVYVKIEELQLVNREDFRWQKNMERICNFVFSFGESIDPNLYRDHLKLVDIKPSIDIHEAGRYDLIAMYKDQCFSALLRRKTVEEGAHELVEFKPMDISASEYYRDYYKDNRSQDSIILEKNPYIYNDFEEEKIS